MPPAIGSSAGLRGGRPAAWAGQQDRVRAPRRAHPALAVSPHGRRQSRPCQPLPEHGARPADGLPGGCRSPAVPAACSQLPARWGSPSHAHSPVLLPLHRSLPRAAPRRRGSPKPQALVSRPGRVTFLQPLAPAQPPPIPSGRTDPGRTAPDAPRASSQGSPARLRAPGIWGPARGLSCRKGERRRAVTATTVTSCPCSLEGCGEAGLGSAGARERAQGLRHRPAVPEVGSTPQHVSALKCLGDGR